MSGIFQENIRTFGGSEDSEYFFTPEHIRRQDVSIALLNEVIKSSPDQPENLLSVACSTGVMERQMKKKLGLNIYGVDGAFSALSTAQKRGIQLVCSDVSSLPFKDNFFDYVYAGEIIEHVFDVQNFISELNRVMRVGGHLVLTTPNLAKIDDRVKFLFGISPRQVAPLHEYLYLHIRPFTASSITAALTANGFTNISVKTNVIRVDLSGKKFVSYSKVLANLFPTLGATLIVRGKKESNQTGINETT
jgi:ubiquinone/menaquinone biosynthesis C-methylase UbiE